MVSLQGNTYIMTVTDNFTRFTTIYFLKKKDEAVVFMKEYLARATAIGFPVERVRVDNGGEYSGSSLLAYLKSIGILHQPTVPYSPESNGLAERMNRSLMSKVRAMMKDAQLSRFLWELMTSMAAYLHNRSPSCPLH